MAVMQYKNRKIKVRSPDWDTDYFDIVAGVLQGDTLASYLFTICLVYRFNKIKRIHTDKIKKKNRRDRTQTFTDADYTDDIVLLANIPVQAESLLHRLQRAAVGIGLHVNVDKTEYMCFTQRGDISTLNGSSLKLVDKFT